jgi:hypothetical protein
MDLYDKLDHSYPGRGGLEQRCYWPTHFKLTNEERRGQSTGTLRPEVIIKLVFWSTGMTLMFLKYRSYSVLYASYIILCVCSQSSL